MHELPWTKSFNKSNPSKGGGGDRFNLGSLSSSKTKFVDIQNYDGNSDFVVDYVFENSRPTNKVECRRLCRNVIAQ